MALCWPSVLLLIYAFSIHINAAKTTLTPELTNFVPACAQDCFRSFLDTNYASEICGTRPNLDCLCRTKGSSEYTVGEGAIQCILLQVSNKVCDENAGQAFKAYAMCIGKDQALPNTHGTLTATFVQSTTSLPSTSSRTTSKSNYSISTAITASRTKAPFPTSTTSTESTSETSPANTRTPAATEDASEKLPTPSPMLTKEQVIGITVGSVAGGVLGIIGLIIFACWKKRKTRQVRDSDMLPFQTEPSPTLYYGPGFQRRAENGASGPGAISNGIAARVTPRVPPRLDTTTPNMFSRRSIKPDMIGVAISPENKFPAQEKERRKSKLLPEKPSLSLQSPLPPDKNDNGLSFSQFYQVNKSAVSRQSTATQFEEDFDDSEDTAVAADETWGRGSSDNIIQPADQPGQTIRTVPPDSAPPPAAFFVAGGDRNNRGPGQATMYSNQPIAPEYYMKPLTLGRGPVGSFSQPRRPEEYPARSQVDAQAPQHQQEKPAQTQRPKLQVAVPRQYERPTTTSSSIYDGRTSLPASGGGRNSNSRPPSFSNGARTRRSYRSAGPYDTLESAGSFTSFETTDSFMASPQDLEPNSKPTLNVKTDVEVRRRTLPVDLSPVVESPPSGRSPVSYPKIPARGRLPENTIRMVPPPKQPDFMSVFTSGRTIGGPSPVAREPGGVSPMGNTPIEGNAKPWRAAELQAQREREQERAYLVAGNGAARLQQQDQRQIQQSQFPPRMQSQQAGTGQVWPAQSTGVMWPQPTRGQPPQDQMQPQRRQERQYIAPSAHYNYMAPPSRSFIQPSASGTPRHPSQIQPQYQPYQPYQQQQQNEPKYITTPPPVLNSTSNPTLRSPFRPTQAQAPINPLTSNPALTFTRTSSQASFHSQTSTSSSLLAKRRGEQKAIALTLTTNQSSSSTLNPNSNGRSRDANGKWRVLDEEQIKQAKSVGWKPMTGSNERERESKGGDRYASYGEGELPRTPGWVPRLTPTRRGDELFLSVQ